MSYIHLTIEKRSQIEVLRKEEYSVRRIASLIGVHHSTVARELNRVEGEYSALCQMLGCSPYEPSLAPIIFMVGAILFAQK